MGELYTFQDDRKRWTITVKSEFLQVCPEPHKYNQMDLMQKFKMNQYLHNPNGPAVIRHGSNPLNGNKVDQLSWWIDGDCFDQNPEKKKALEHAYNFNNRVLDVLEE